MITKLIKTALLALMLSACSTTKQSTLADWNECKMQYDREARLKCY